MKTKTKLTIILISLAVSTSLIYWQHSTLIADVRAQGDYRVQKVDKSPEKPKFNASRGVIREVTMYTSRIQETDSSPCISADGTNICEVDYNVCATNAFPFGTTLEVDKLGTCIVRDRMNIRYQNRIDWYARYDLQRALQFGRQKLLVTIK